MRIVLYIFLIFCFQTMVAQSITELHTIKSPITLDNFATTQVDNKYIYVLSTNSDSVLLDDVTRWYSSPWPSPTQIHTYFTIVDTNQQFLLNVQIASKGSIYSPVINLTVDSSYILSFTYYGDTLRINDTLFSNDNSGYGALCVTKIKKDGSIAFCKSFPGYPGNVQIASFPDGKIVVSGTTNQGKMNFDGQILYPFGMGSVSDSDVFVAVLDSMGQVIHVKRFGGIEYDYCFYLLTTEDGSIYLSGEFLSGIFHIDSLTLTCNGGGKFGLPDALLLKMDSTLKPIWFKQVKGYGFQRGMALEEDKYGKIYWGFEYSNYQSYLEEDTLHGGLDNAMICQLDSTGNILWKHRFASSKRIFLTGSSIDVDNNVWLTLAHEDSLKFENISLFGIGGQNYSLVKMNSGGAFLQWINIPGPTSESIDNVQPIGNHQLFIAGGVGADFSFLNLHIEPDPASPRVCFHFILDLNTVGTQEPLLVSIQFSAFPNPVPMGGQVQIQLQSPVRQGQINVYNVLGQSVAQAAIPNQATKISFVAPRQAGLYYLTVSAGGQSTTQKIVVGQ